MRLNDSLSDVLGPVRDIHVAALLTALAAELGRGAEVDAEAVERDADGKLRRDPPLGLPSRCDLRVLRDGRVLTRRMPRESELSFAPLSAPLSDVAQVRIAPFCWGAAPVFTRRAAGAPNWAPLRLWYLEWFQARFGEESPDLLGVVHRLDGPRPEGDGWRFVVDLGSVSVAGFAAMLDAFGLTGCADITVGEPEGAL